MSWIDGYRWTNIILVILWLSTVMFFLNKHRIWACGEIYGTPKNNHAFQAHVPNEHDFKRP